MNSINKKALYSKNIIKEALFTLMQNDLFEMITITQICQEAQIGRATFYRNFNKKEDVIQFEIENRLNELLEDVTDLYELRYDAKKFYNVFYKQKDFIAILFKHNLVIYFMNCFFTYMTDYYKVDLNETANMYDKYIYNVFVYEILCMLDLWHFRDFNDNIDELFNIMDTHPRIIRK